jgi:hypothetical protein
MITAPAVRTARRFRRLDPDRAASGTSGAYEE